MIKGLKSKYVRVGIPVVLALVMVSSQIAPAALVAADQTRFNAFSNDNPTVQIASKTKTPNCSSCWSDSISSVDDGDIISVAVYYHNTGSFDARGTRVSIKPTQIGPSTIKFEGKVWASNASAKTGRVRATMEGDLKANDLKLVDTLWYPNRSTSNPRSIGGSVTGSGVSVGTVEYGWDFTGYVVARFEVGADGGGSGDTSDKPDLTTESATGVTGSKATLSCEVDANGANTTAWFEWGTDDNNLNKDTSTRTVSKNQTDLRFTKKLQGLEDDTEYYFRCVGENSEGSGEGTTKSFTTDKDDDPTPSDDDLQVTTKSPEDVNHDDATLVCDVDGTNGEDTKVWIEYGEDEDDLNDESDTERVDNDGNVEIDIDNLDDDTEYHYRCYAENDDDDDRGLVRSFTTDDRGSSSGDRPRATTLSADRVDDDSARLRCDVDTNGDDAEVWFEWGDSRSNLDEDTDPVDVDDRETDERVTETIDDLDEDERYYFRCVVEDDGGERDRGDIRYFTTDDNGRRSSDDEPQVRTLSATGVGQNTATLEGDVDPNGDDTDVWFQWGTSINNLNRTTSREDVGDRGNDIDFDYRVSGLAQSTTYYYRAVAENDEGRDYGVVRSFRTGSPIVNVITRFIEIERPVEEEPEVEALIITLDADRVGAEDSREIDYTVSYDNRTDETFTDAQLVVDLPRELDFVDADPREDRDRGDELIFDIGTISPGEEDSFVITTDIDRSVDVDEEIRFVADVEYTDDDTRKVVTVIDEHTFGELVRGRTGGVFTANILDALRDFFTSPILWLILLALLVYFAIRYFVASRDKRSAALV